MQITITIHGEPDILPYKKRFRFQKPDDEIFIASCEKIQKMQTLQQKININETLLLFAGFVVSYIMEGKTANRTRQDASSILSAGQVMIGVPEMLQRLDFEVILDKKYTVSLYRPIPVRDIALRSSVRGF